MQEHDCSLTREIVELVDREADLLVRGMKDETLKGTKYGISVIFHTCLQFALEIFMQQYIIHFEQNENFNFMNYGISINFVQVFVSV